MQGFRKMWNNLHFTWTSVWGMNKCKSSQWLVNFYCLIFGTYTLQRHEIFHQHEPPYEEKFSYWNASSSPELLIMSSMICLKAPFALRLNLCTQPSFIDFPRTASFTCAGSTTTETKASYWYIETEWNEWEPAESLTSRRGVTCSCQTPPFMGGGANLKKQ